MSKTKYVVIVFIALLGVYIVITNPSSSDVVKLPITISTVSYGIFEEWIPVNGTIDSDSGIVNKYKVLARVHEIYLSKISKGLQATTTINNTDYSLTISNTCPTKLTDGYFDVELIFNEDVGNIFTRGDIRLRVQLPGARNALLLPVDAFYKDTRGKWIFLVGENDIVVKRKIKLGDKNTESFEVLEGLNSGDRVITSSYENFMNVDSVQLSSLEKL